MAIPPKQGDYIQSDFKAKIDEAMNALQWISSQFDRLKADEVVTAKKLDENAAQAKAENKDVKAESKDYASHRK